MAAIAAAALFLQSVITMAVAAADGMKRKKRDVWGDNVMHRMYDVVWSGKGTIGLQMGKNRVKYVIRKNEKWMKTMSKKEIFF